MAKIAHRFTHHGVRQARINAVVTERAQRGKGYAKMLTGTLARKILAEGLTPMLYADADNPFSNRAYLHVGFVKQGEICTYTFQ